MIHGAAKTFREDGVTLLLFTLLAANLEMTDVKIMQPIPEDLDLFLENPAHMDLDDDGNLYVVDLDAAKIFIWDAQGQYKGHFGKKGEGPGEFAFNGSAGGPHGYVSIVGNDIYIYDGGKRTLSVFDTELNFKSRDNFKMPGGRAEYFQILEDGRIFLYNSSYFSDVPYKKIAFYSKDMEELKQIYQAKDETWEYGEENGNRRVILKIFSPGIMTHFDTFNKEIIVGNPSSPKFEIYGSDGNLKRTVDVKLVQQDVTRDDIEEWESQEWVSRSTFFKMTYMDKKPYYSNVLPFKDKGYLVYLQSPVYGKASGIFVDRQGKTKGRFTMALGEGGWMSSVDGRIFVVRINEMGDIEIGEMAPNIDKS
jgi:hypothetical protein